MHKKQSGHYILEKERHGMRKLFKGMMRMGMCMCICSAFLCA